MTSSNGSIFRPRYWPFVRGIHRSPVNSPHKGQWPGALMISLICARINGWVNNGEAGDLRRHRAHYDVIIMDIECVGQTRTWLPQRYSFRVSLPMLQNNRNWFHVSQINLNTTRVNFFPNYVKGNNLHDIKSNWIQMRKPFCRSLYGQLFGTRLFWNV